MIYLHNYGNERDVEIPCLIEFIKERKDIESILDVGCAKSLYAKQLRELTKNLGGVDLVKDKEIVKYFNAYFVGNYFEIAVNSYDLVVSISTIEHVGIKDKRIAFPLFTQQKFIKKMAGNAKKYLYFTMPYGQPSTVRGDFIIYGRNRLADTLYKVKGFKFNTRFFTCPNPREKGNWTEVAQSEADKMGYDEKLGVRGVCVVTGTINVLQNIQKQVDST